MTKSNETKTEKTINVEEIVKTTINSKIAYKTSFEFLTTERDIASLEAVKAYYFIGEIVQYFSDNYNQKESAALRTLALSDLNLSRNEISGCKFLFGFGTLNNVLEVFRMTNCKSVNAARIAATIRNYGKEETEETKTADILKSLTAVCNKVEKSELSVDEKNAIRIILTKTLVNL